MCMVYTILWLKMVSYVQVNYWCRQKRHKTKKLSKYFSIAPPPLVVNAVCDLVIGHYLACCS